MAASQTINQRDLRMRSREIMDAVEAGESFTVTRDGRDIGELRPLRRTRVFVPREDLVALQVRSEPIDLDRFRSDLDAGYDDAVGDPYGS